MHKKPKITSQKYPNKQHHMNTHWIVYGDNSKGYICKKWKGLLYDNPSVRNIAVDSACHNDWGSINEL